MWIMTLLSRVLPNGHTVTANLTWFPPRWGEHKGLRRRGERPTACMARPTDKCTILLQHARTYTPTHSNMDVLQQQCPRENPERPETRTHTAAVCLRGRVCGCVGAEGDMMIGCQREACHQARTQGRQGVRHDSRHGQTHTEQKHTPPLAQKRQSLLMGHAASFCVINSPPPLPSLCQK